MFKGANVDGKEWVCEFREAMGGQLLKGTGSHCKEYKMI